MNFGYNSQSKYWREDKKYELASRIQQLLESKGWGKPYCGVPYTEVDGLYDGVRIRKVTHLSPEELQQLNQEADQIYLEVMNKKQSKEME